MEATDAWAIFCRASVSDCTKRASWQNEISLTDKSFNFLDAPLTTQGYMVGDYTGLTRAGSAVVAAIGVADGKGQSSIYSRKISGFGGTAEVASATGQ